MSGAHAVPNARRSSRRAFVIPHARFGLIASSKDKELVNWNAALLVRGTDLVRTNGHWSNANARGYKRGAQVKDPFQLRVNAYRVLLTRGRDGTVIFVPPVAALDETYEYLVAAGVVAI